MIFCPFCDDQGLIHKAKIIGSDIQIFLCDECDTMWKTEEIRHDNSENFGRFMHEHGLRGLWSELYDVERL